MLTDIWGQALTVMMAWPPITPLDVELCWLPMLRMVRSWAARLVRG